MSLSQKKPARMLWTVTMWQVATRTAVTTLQALGSL